MKTIILVCLLIVGCDNNELYEVRGIGEFVPDSLRSQYENFVKIQIGSLPQGLGDGEADDAIREANFAAWNLYKRYGDGRVIMKAVQGADVLVGFMPDRPPLPESDSIIITLIEPRTITIPK